MLWHKANPIQFRRGEAAKSSREKHPQSQTLPIWQARSGRGFHPHPNLRFNIRYQMPAFQPQANQERRSHRRRCQSIGSGISVATDKETALASNQSGLSIIRCAGWRAQILGVVSIGFARALSIDTGKIGISSCSITPSVICEAFSNTSRGTTGTEGL